MAILKKGRDIDARYSRITPVCKILWRGLHLLAYVAAGLAALLLVVSFVLLFVDVSADELLFTPFMKITEADGGKMFDVRLGNGVEVLRPYDEVTARNIKGVLYSGIFTLVAGLLVSVPVFFFLGRLFKNVGNGTVLSADNAAYVNYIGLTIMVGNPFVLFVKRFFNYALIKNFVQADIKFDFGIDMFGVFLGLLIIVLGTVYGQACALHKKEMALVLRDADD